MSSRNRLYHLYNAVPFSRKRPRRPGTGIKDGFEEMEHEFPFGIFHPEKQVYLFRFSVAVGNVRWEGPKSSVFHLLSNQDFPENFFKW